MANYSDAGAVLTYTGATSGANAVPTAYPSTTSTFYGGAGVSLKLYCKLVTDAASNLTSFGIKLQESYDASAGSWVDVVMVDNVSGGTAATEKVQTVSAGTTTWVVLATANARFAKNLQVVVKGNGGAVKVGDAVTIYATAW